MADVSAIVLCGGTSRRMGGADKTALALGDTTVLDHLLDELPSVWPVVCVGVERPTRRKVFWTREKPPGGGPVAGIAVGLEAVDAHDAHDAHNSLDAHDAHDAGSPPSGGAGVVVVLAGDQPFAAPVAVELADRLSAHPEADAATALDGEGRRQPLLTAYRTAALRRAVPRPAADTPARHLLRALRVVEVPQPDHLVHDVDTPAALEQARERARQQARQRPRTRGAGPA